jgi:transposase-like protein
MTTEPMNDAELEDFGDVAPDTLPEKFHGRSLIPIAVFAVVVHAVVLIGTSVPYIVTEFLGPNTAKMSDKDRLDAATRKATEALRDIAREHGLNPQDLSNNFATKPAAPPPAAKTTDATEDEPKKPDEPEREKSQYEKDLETKAEGPKVPSVEEDLFK